MSGTSKVHFRVWEGPGTESLCGRGLVRMSGDASKVTCYHCQKILGERSDMRRPAPRTEARQLFSAHRERIRQAQQS